MAKWAAMCLALFACSGSSGPKHPASGIRDAGAHDAAPEAHDAATHDAAVDARAMQPGEPMMSTPDAAMDAAAATSCADQSLAIAQKVFDAIATAQVTNRCSTEEDCITLQPLHNSCYDGCSLPVSRNGLTAVQLALDTLERTTCPAFIQSGCMVDSPMCQQPPTIACHTGRCTVSPSAGDRCATLSRSVSDRIMQAMANADRRCVLDTDCTVLSPVNPCFSDCTQELILSHAGAAGVQQAVDAATLAICPAFFGAGCELNQAICDQPAMRARCVGQMCMPVPMR